MTFTEIRHCLRAYFHPEYLHLQDDSKHHQGHFQGDSTKGPTHVSVVMVSSHFQEQSPIQRHRLIHQVLRDFLEPQGNIHALALRLYTPTEYAKLQPHLERKPEE